MSDTRRRIHEHVESNPGVHFNALARELDLAAGQVQYHVRKLLGNDRIVEEPVYGRTHYYPPTYTPWERRAVALARRETCRELLRYLLAAGSARPDEAAEAVGIARSTLQWHLDRLVEAELVEKRHVKSGIVLEPVRPAETRRLLEEITPSVGDRLVDRFVSMVDDALDAN